VEKNAWVMDTWMQFIKIEKIISGLVDDYSRNIDYCNTLCAILMWQYLYSCLRNEKDRIPLDLTFCSLKSLCSNILHANTLHTSSEKEFPKFFYWTKLFGTC
jgi:hypothetical protein